MELRAGDRQTGVSAIPADWRVARLGDIGKWFSGGTPSMASPVLWNGEVPWVSPKDMKVSRLHEAIDHVSEKAIGNGARLIPAGALLMVVRGMILAHSFPVARAERPLTFNQDLKAVVVREDVDSNFFLHWLSSREQQMRSLATESTHGTKRLPTGDLLCAECVCPPLTEQRAIAAALGDLDSLLDGLTQLIAKKRDLKQAAMQQLLTGQTRLPGFSDEWEVVPVGKAGDVLGGRQRSPHSYGRPTKYLRVANVLDGYIDTSDVLEMPFSPDERKRFRLEQGDILLNEGQSIDLVGRSAIYTGDPPDCCFQNTLIRFRAGARTDVQFAQLLFQRFLQTGVFASIALQTTSIAHLGARRCAALRMPLPPVAEQRAIAELLSDMEAEIAALKARHHKTLALKQGMMQELLTGRTRLI